jgi:SAM-dependent methyltransferase
LVRTVRQRVNAALPPRRVPGITGPVHRNDTMLRATGHDRYERTGIETIALFADRAEGAGVDTTAAAWFEIGCGYGRLVRALTARVDPAQVSVCDIDPAASAFCAKTFRVRRVLSDVAFRFEPPVTADVVYALSVATHLPWEGFERFLAAAWAAVRPGGVLLFTTHGQVALDQLHVYDDGAYVPAEADLRSGYGGERGFAYVPYAFEPEAGYGMAWHRAEAALPIVRDALGGEGAAEVRVEEAAIEGHQDLWVCHRRAGGAT